MNNTKRVDQAPVLNEITEDIRLLSLPYSSGMEQVNCFIFRGEKGYTVVDTGSYSDVGIRTWEKLMASGMTIEKVVLTHSHIDHLGLARWFQEKHHIPIYISSKGYQAMLSRQNKDEHKKFVDQLFKQHGFKEERSRIPGDFSHIYHFVPDGLVDEGQEIKIGNEMYEAIWTPGHSSDQYCFYQHEQEIMILGDHILEKLSPVILIEAPTYVNPLQDYFSSLEKIKDYGIRLALPGHGHVLGEIGERVESIRSGHIRRMDQVLDILKKEEKTAWEICREIYGTKNVFATMMATITRCIYLESVGKIKSKVMNGTINYCKIK